MPSDGKTSHSHTIIIYLLYMMGATLKEGVVVAWIIMQTRPHNSLRSLHHIRSSWKVPRSIFAHLPAPRESCIHIDSEKDNGSTNWFCTDDPLDLEAVNSTQVKDSALHVQSQDALPTPFSSKQAPHMSMELPEDMHRNCQPSHSAPELTSAKRGKRQKTKSSIDDFHERYPSLKREEMERFAAIEERKLEDPYSIQKCITALEGLPDLQMGDMLKAAHLFTDNKENREVFLSFSTNALRLGWLRNKIQNT